MMSAAREEVVLLVEDDEGLVGRIRKILETLELRVETAMHLAAAQAAFARAACESRQAFSCAIVDLMLPRDADAFAECARLEGRLREFRQILMNEKDDDRKLQIRQSRHHVQLEIDELIEKRAGFIVAEEAERQGVPMVFLTAVSNPDVRLLAEARWPGAQWLAKPVSANELVCAVQNACRER